MKFILFLAISIKTCFSFESKGMWIEIPPSSFVVEEKDDSSIELKNRIDTYHSLDKTDLKELTKRINLLDDMQQLYSVEKELQGNKKIRNFISHSKNRSYYLKNIKEIYECKNIKDQFEVIQGETGKHKPLYLVNDVFFDFKLPTYWGLFWLEVIDPSHRFLTGHYLKWVEKQSNVPFFLWLEDQEISHDVTQVYFLKDEEIENNTLEIENGLFTYKKTSEIINYDDANQEYIFSILLNETILVAKSTQSIRHTSLTHGKPVLAAGALKIKEGVLSYIDAESGHYQPTFQSLCQAIRILKHKGASINEITLDVKYYYNTQAFYEKYSDALQKFEILSQKPLEKRPVICDFKV